ncbi:MAG: class I SAM-dependent methyltransferase, partial [Solirubrobacteraceae bacterium]
TGERPFYEQLVVREKHSRNLVDAPLEPKVAHRGDPTVVVMPGNHGISGAALAPAPDCGLLEVLHYPMRTFAQFERKVLATGVGYESLPFRSPEVGRDQLRLLELQRSGKLRAYFDGQVRSTADVLAGLRGGELVLDRRLARFMAEAQHARDRDLDPVATRPDSEAARALLAAALGGPGEPPAHSSLARNPPYAPTNDNRPLPLDRGALPLTQDAAWQMSFGERAVLEGILAQVRPRLALEIGTAEGGSLARIAAYSAEVHSIDLTHDQITRDLPSHVARHTGSSGELLVPLLESFVSRGRSLDFVLVDGDHSFEGVRSDLLALLESAATARSVILVHDTMNAEIRAGIESLALDEDPKLVYYELDLVPGYVFRDGECRGAIWGGIGLLLTDRSRSTTYPQGPRQTRYCELHDLLHRHRSELLE